MTVTLDALNAMPAAELATRLRDCCGSSRWIQHMLMERPFRSVEHLLSLAETAWKRTEPDDWQEAFDHHPRIGERRAEATVSPEATRWSHQEQAASTLSDEHARREIARAGTEYERRFGRIYIVCATGLSAGDILADVRRRLDNEPEFERSVAAAEQAKITALRLRKLIGQTL